MVSRKNKTIKTNKTNKNGDDYFGKQFLDNYDKKLFENDKDFAEKIKKNDSSVQIVFGKYLKPGCSYTFVDPSVLGKDVEFTVKSIRKNPEEVPKSAAGESYLLTNEGWWITDFPIGENDQFVKKKCKTSGGKKRKTRKQENKKTRK